MNLTVTSQTARLTGPRELRFEETVLDSSQMKDKELLGETLVSALSVGTELAAYLGKPPLRPGPVYPRLVGYCNVARVLATGSQVKNYQAGDLILTNQSHTSAFICAESAVLTAVPPEADLGAAATTYLFHLGYSSLINTEFRPGHHVAVIGLGVIGLGAVALAALSSGRVAAFSEQAAHLQLAEGIGAAKAYRKSDPQSITDYQAKTLQGGADMVILTSDSWEDWLLAMKLVRKGGTIGVISFPGRGQTEPGFNPLDSQYFYDKSLRIVAAGNMSTSSAAPHEVRFTRKRNCAFLLELIASGKLPARRLISGEHPWHELAKVYESLETRRAGGLTHLLHWKSPS